MASMRSVLAVGVFGIALFGAPSQLSAADAILSGSIKSPAGEAMGGVMVSAKAEGGTITTTVLTDEAGATTSRHSPPANTASGRRRCPSRRPRARSISAR